MGGASADALRGQVAIVTGAANGIGRAFAEGLSEQGVAVVACDIDADDPVAGHVKQHPFNPVATAVDR